jgi:hypothetical protein
MGNKGLPLFCQITLERLTPSGQALVPAIRADPSSVDDPF